MSKRRGVVVSTFSVEAMPCKSSCCGIKPTLLPKSLASFEKISNSRTKKHWLGTTVAQKKRKTQPHPVSHSGRRANPRGRPSTRDFPQQGSPPPTFHSLAQPGSNHNPHQGLGLGPPQRPLPPSNISLDIIGPSPRRPLHTDTHPNPENMLEEVREHSTCRRPPRHKTTVPLKRLLRRRPAWLN